MKTRTPDEKLEENQEDDGMETCMKELAEALGRNDFKAAAQIFKDAHQIADSEPHEEGPHTPEPHSYDSQNQKAAGENR